MREIKRLGVYVSVYPHAHTQTNTHTHTDTHTHTYIYIYIYIHRHTHTHTHTHAHTHAHTHTLDDSIRRNAKRSFRLKIIVLPSKWAHTDYKITIMPSNRF